MLKYSDIIEKLSERDKIRILSDIRHLSDETYRELNLPVIRPASVERKCGDDYPGPSALANSWNTELIERVAGDVIDKIVKNGDNLVKLPAPKPRINPYSKALSEDPLLASAVSESYARAARNKGVASVLEGIGIRSDEAEWLDKEPNEAFLAEYLVNVYTEVSKNSSVSATLTDHHLDRGIYQSVNDHIQNKIGSKAKDGNLYVIYSAVDSDKTVSHLARGEMFFEGSLSSLESALMFYKRSKAAIEHGTSTTEELNAAIESGKAISPEMLDEAVDRLLDIAFEATKRHDKAAENYNSDASDENAFSAARESVVLLKNKKNTLPLNSKERVCIIGDIANLPYRGGVSFADLFGNRMIKHGVVLCGKARGYDIQKNRGEELLSSAMQQAYLADTVILFLGLGKKRENEVGKTRQNYIPANQQRLLLELKKSGKKIIAILPPDYAPDVKIEDACDAILFAPLESKFAAAALSDVLVGEFNPCGKLANSVYFNSEKLYVERKTRVERDGIKTGSFLGYRYYDTAKSFAGFPFGHGLSYTKFSYGLLCVGRESVVFRVKNCGKKAGAEVAQLYIGCEGSGYPRPDKQLCGFTRVELAPGQSKMVEIPYKLPLAFDPKTGKEVEEKCRYTLYIGASVADIRLKRVIRGGSEKIACGDDNISRYIHTKSNIISDNFKLEAKTDIMRKSVFNFIAGVGALLLALSLKMYCIFMGIDISVLDVFSAILAISGIVFFIVEGARRSRIRSEERKRIEKLNIEAFKSAERMKVYAAKKMFVQEFDVNDQIASLEKQDASSNTESEKLAHIDKDQNFANAAKDFELLALEQGYKLAEGEAFKLFAALASSRLLITVGMDDEKFNAFLKIVSNYFHATNFIDKVDETFTDGNRLFFRQNVSGNKVKAPIHYAIEAGKNDAHKFSFAGLTDVRSEDILTYFSVFNNYIKNPAGCKYVVSHNEKNIETAYYMPQNIWFVLNLAPDQNLVDLPKYIAESAAVLKVDFEECEASQEHSHVRKFSYYQLDYLVEKAISKYSVDEDIWKKLDRLEEYVNARNQFSVGNRVWLGLEKFAYTYMACGGTELVAVDEAMAARVMPLALAALSGNELETDAGVAETLDLIFGEEKIEACKDIVDYVAFVEKLLRERAEAAENSAEDNNAQSDEAQSDETQSDEAQSDEAQSDETQSDEEAETVEASENDAANETVEASGVKE